MGRRLCSNQLGLHPIINFKTRFPDSAAVVGLSTSIRDEFHGLLTEFFGGDTLAADYLLCHLASRV